MMIGIISHILLQSVERLSRDQSVLFVYDDRKTYRHISTEDLFTPFEGVYRNEQRETGLH